VSKFLRFKRDILVVICSVALSVVCCRVPLFPSVYYYIRGGKLKYVISVIKLIRTEKQRVLKDFYMNIQQDFNLRSFVMQTT